MAGITAAYALASTQQLRDAYDVTVYQLGWRLGGKGASGRNPDRFQSIEEHGLHVWLGFYDNAFRVMRNCYEELGESWTDYFEPCDNIVLYEHYRGQWHAREYTPPANDREPGEGGRPDFSEMVHTALEWLRTAWDELLESGDTPIGLLEQTIEAWIPDPIEALWDRIVDEIEEELEPTVGGLLDTAVHLAEAAGDYTEVCTILRVLRTALWTGIVEPNVDHPDIRLYFMLFDTMATMTCGIIDDDLIERGLDAVDDEEFTEWLLRHGASDVTLGDPARPTEGSPLLRGGYDLAFGYETGDLSRRNIAAGVGIRGLLLLLFGYKGSMMFKMRAGMGDVVFAPFYRLLHDRYHVRFEFFHWVTKLELSADKSQIETIELLEQAGTVGGGEYDPLIQVRGLDCWPSEPDWDQLQHGQQLKSDGVDLEREASPPHARNVTLSGGTDFDVVVLAIPVGALDDVCSDLKADQDNPRFRLMMENSHTVMTQAFQLWMTKPIDELGWVFHDNSIAGSYVEPIDTYCNMTHLLAKEGWAGAAEQPQSLAYFCGVLEDRPGDTWQSAQDRAKDNALRFLSGDFDQIWPQAVHPSSAPEIDWDLLVDNHGRSGRARFDAQYWLANFQPTERYVLSTAGSIAYRLSADESGYANLFLAGDWTKNGIDAGCIEATVMSGLQAARAIAGVSIEVTDEDDRWLRAEAPRLFVKYGGTVTAPQPYRCENTTLYGFFLKARLSKLRSLCRRVFAEPTGGEFRYEPLGNRVMLTFGHIGKLTHSDPAQGYTAETQVAVWVPTAAVRRLGPVWFVDHVAWFVPYMWVDNPLTYVGGREVYGYPKNWGWVEPPRGAEGPFRLDVFGGDFGPAETAHRTHLLSVTKSQDGPDSGDVWEALSDAGQFLWDAFSEPTLLIPTIGAPGRFLGDLARRRVTEVFLKQFRSATDGRVASSQQIVEAPIQVEKVKGGPLFHRYDFDLRRLDSHPLGDDLGLESQSTSLAFQVSLDFVLERGEVVWEARR
jgi:uncharacterized protein with NAD-binding domain and iron-sulfur cluster